MKNTNAVRTEIHYAQVGEYQLPLLTLPQTDDSEPLGKYGRMRLAYLKTQRPVLYHQMLLNGTLWPHLQDAQKTACAWLERTMTTLLDKYPAPDKERAQLLWVAHMNGLKAQALGGGAGQPLHAAGQKGVQPLAGLLDGEGEGGHERCSWGCRPFSSRS